jgi:tRNA threonylcarbamoyladenosine biosynthesis protein TsaB
MALLLNIDTATEKAGVCIAENENVLTALETGEQKNHASFIQPAIKQLLSITGLQLSDIDAIAVSGGPGSYTGLRVGLSTAKGLCYALSKPLIMVNTLEIIALAAIKKNDFKTGFLYCPMIDARRMEVFTAIYDAGLNIVTPPQALILEENSFQTELGHTPVLFSGSGAAKAKIIQHPNAFFTEIKYSTGEMAVLSSQAYKASFFANLAYSEPFYLKEFYKGIKKN